MSSRLSMPGSVGLSGFAQPWGGQQPQPGRLDQARGKAAQRRMNPSNLIATREPFLAEKLSLHHGHAV